MNERFLVQLAGPARAGKSEVAKHLAEEHDFTVVLISDIIRAYADMRGLELLQRDSYLKTFKAMKEDLGADVVANTILEADSDRICTDGNRVPADVDRLRKAARGVVIALECPPHIRFARAQQLASPLDKTTFAEFVQDDLAESTGDDPELQMLGKVMAGADYKVSSHRPLEVVCRDVDSIVIPLLA